MTSMQNAGAPQQSSQVMYYYVAVPNQGPQQPFVPGGEGMNQGAPFDAQQVQTFPGGSQVYYSDTDPSNMGGVNVAQMGHMPAAMMPTGQAGGMMVLTTMMPQSQQQSPPMEQPQDNSQPNGAWQGMPQQNQMDPQSQLPGRSNTGSRAFKIVNPLTNEEVKVKLGDESPGGCAAPVPGGSPNAGTGTAGLRGNEGNAQQQGQGQGQVPMQWPPQGFVPAMGPTQSGGMGHGGASPSMQQGSPVQPAVVQQSMPIGGVQPNSQASGGQQGGGQQQAPAPPVAAPRSQPAAVGSKKKMMNKKITKPKGDETSAEASSVDPDRPAQAAAATEPSQHLQQQQQQTPQTPQTPPAAAQQQPQQQPPQQQQGDEESSKPRSGGGSGNLPPGSGSGGGGQSTANLLKQSHLSQFSGQGLGGSSHFASSIKALNLEPMRANTATFRPKASPNTKAHGDGFGLHSLVHGSRLESLQQQRNQQQPQQQSGLAQQQASQAPSPQEQPGTSQALQGSQKQAQSQQQIQPQQPQQHQQQTQLQAHQ
eukprot:CAMPEP_0117557846 /NCGR_PEP_ID=MMETSP0784-20121206/52533_1 /TAXON_ID=39447 /ORGANISM="" /LENGTH=533 /DNA_ID=CAMNT_0005355161 /DNA_START=61 /DNA_END=1659 /DNA_ORIENTATION=-